MPDERLNEPHAIIVMGVSGCGKSSVGEKLAEALHLPFVEGDALHPAANVEKMSKGIPRCVSKVPRFNTPRVHTLPDDRNSQFNPCVPPFESSLTLIVIPSKSTSWLMHRVL